MFENHVLFTNCISEITNKQVDNAKYLDVAKSKYNLIKKMFKSSRKFTPILLT